MPPNFYIELMWHGGDGKYLLGFPTASRLPSKGWAPFVSLDWVAVELVDGCNVLLWNSEVKRVGGWSNPRMGDHPKKLLRELPETNPCGTLSMGGLVGAHWLRVRRNSEVKRDGGWSNPRMSDHPGKLLRELPETNPCGTLSSGPRADNILLRRSRSGV
ncbi:hypothetical protein L3X38_032568 [Prunus dulcis]|uniref:Uncharacterized protein n=1 Tax=Prunus dulcis TaxID=3755 RepID=A0AAD4YW06_PRUDU|nr:hypothetical protein L3X38_032568 [Prunus dulcis]